jgi:ferritin-like protein
MPTGMVMDAAHYEIIADKLMQFRGKLPKSYHLHDDHACSVVKNMKELIEHLLNEIDQIARMDDLGMIR